MISIYNFRFIISIILIVSTKILFSQSPKDLISVENLNASFLEHLIKIKIDSVRNQLGLSYLVNDSILYIAAKYHADWLETNNAFSHTERGNTNHETPQERVDFYGVKNYYVGENLVKSYINKPLKVNKNSKKTYINRTYNDIANDFVVGWVSSPGHYANIKTADYNKTGMAISVNKKKKLIYAVQKFANVLFQYSFEENKSFFSYTEYQNESKINSFEAVKQVTRPIKYQWNIKPSKPDSKLCVYCNEVLENREYRDYLKPKGKSLYYKSFNVDVLKNIIKKPKSALLIEEVEYLAYDCGNPAYYTQPSRRNGYSIFNGKLYEPIYKKELKQSFFGSKNPYFKKRLARLKDSSYGYVEMNILVLQKNRLCRVMHFTDFCGSQYLPDINIQLKDTLIPFVYEIPKVRDTLNFQIPFEKNQYDFKMEDIKPLLGAFENTKFEIIDADIMAYSSLEGNEKLNDELQEKRALGILEVFQNNQQNTINYNINSLSNWKVFKGQIEAEDDLKSLRKLSNNEILNSLGDKEFLAEIEEYLNQQRYGEISLLVEYFENTDDIARNTLTSLRSIFQGEIILTNSLADSIYKMIYKLYEIDYESNANFKYLKSAKEIIPIETVFYEYTIDALVASGYYKIDSSFTFYNSEIRALDYPSYHSLYNRIQIAVRNLNEEINLTQDLIVVAMNDFDSIRPLLKKADKLKIDSLEMKFYIAALNYYYKQDSTDLLAKEFKMFSKLLAEKVDGVYLSDEELFKIAQHLVFFENDLPAYKILQKLITKQTKIEAVYVLFAKMSYVHNQEYARTDYHEYLIKLYPKINDKTWCEMFVGPCNISFQIFDYEPLRNFYCEKCSQYKNYANQ